MATETKVSKEELQNEKRLNANYEKTNYCTKCNIKLQIDIKNGCGNPICN